MKILISQLICDAIGSLTYSKHCLNFHNFLPCTETEQMDINVQDMYINAN